MAHYLKNILKAFALLFVGFLLGVLLLYALLSYEHSRAGNYLKAPTPYAMPQVVPHKTNELVEI